METETFQERVDAIADHTEPSQARHAAWGALCPNCNPSEYARTYATHKADE